MHTSLSIRISHLFLLHTYKLLGTSALVMKKYEHVYVEAPLFLSIKDQVSKGGVLHRFRADIHSYISPSLPSLSVFFRCKVGSDHWQRQKNLWWKKKEERCRVVVVVVVRSAVQGVLRDWDRWKEKDLFWRLGADGGRAWVGFGRLDHFASKSCSIRIRLGTVYFILKCIFICIYIYNFRGMIVYFGIVKALVCLFAC